MKGETEMNLKKYLSWLAVAFFGIFGFYGLFGGIGSMATGGPANLGDLSSLLSAAAAAGRGGFNVWGLFAMLLGMLLIGFAVLCYLFLCKKENPFILMIGSGSIVALVLLLDVIGIFAGGGSGLDKLVLIALVAVFVYALLLYQQMVAEGKIVRAAKAVAAPQASPEEALKKLASLKEAGLITAEEYEQKRKEYLSKM
jgi:hypothetical protein